jgi:protein CpxP
MTGKIMIAGALALVAIPAVVALAAFRRDTARHGEMVHKFIEWRIDQKLDELKATDAQKQQVRAIEADLLQQGMALKKGNHEFRRALLAELQKDNPDPTQVHALVDARAETMKAFADKVTDGVLQARAILTPEQRAQLFQGLSRHAAKHSERE